ncbi:MAG TPA: hypothetical protein PLR18_03370 [bacterium]|nr:hypothetical protein [bacterium]
MFFPSLRNSLFLQDKIVKVCLLCSLFLTAIYFFLLYRGIQPQVEPLYLRYSIYFGVDLIGPWWSVFLLPFTGLVIFVINTLLARWLFLKANIISYFLLFTSLAIQFFLAIISVLIILLNS